MTVLARDPMQQFTQQLMHLMQTSYAKSNAIGVILTTYSHINPKVIDQLQLFLSKHESELSAEYFFDDQYRILGLVLDDQKLAVTHYTSLLFKDFLERHDLLDGQIIVASFPESGEPTERILLQLFHTVTFTRGESRDISLFVDQPLKRGISSILVADSEEVSRKFIKLRLELQGYEVYEASNGSDAFDQFSQFSPDLVITELTLPVLDGYQLIYRIKEELASDGKVIVLTDKHLAKDMNRAFELGASDYVTKPYSITELEWRIKKLQFS